MEAITVFVAGVFALAVADGLVTVHIPLLMGISGQSAARRLEVKKGLA
jgi:hypothetical protein